MQDRDVWLTFTKQRWTQIITKSLAKKWGVAGGAYAMTTIDRLYQRLKVYAGNAQDGDEVEMPVEIFALRHLEEEFTMDEARYIVGLIMGQQ